MISYYLDKKLSASGGGVVLKELRRKEAGFPRKVLVHSPIVSITLLWAETNLLGLGKSIRRR